MSTAAQGVVLWDLFVADGHERAGQIHRALTDIPVASIDDAKNREPLAMAAHNAFAIATESLLMGDEKIGRLALAIEKLVEAVLGGTAQPEECLPYLVSASHTLAQSFEQLTNPDKSGARVEDLPLDGARYEIETLLPAPGQKPIRSAADVSSTALVRSDGLPPASEPSPEAGATAAVTAWAPSVDDDMVELFFTEVNERLEGLSIKLVEVESRQDDPELLRDVFRDLHTIKGSSAMVGLAPMNDLAHTAEDLVGQIRDGNRKADRATVDALLAALDALRDIAGRASRREPLPTEHGHLLERLRDPSRYSGPTAAPAPQPPVGASLSPTPAQSAKARQTIRVDFDKLDHLLNLVGELVLGRDGLRGSIHSLTALGSDLSSDRQLARRIDMVAELSSRLASDMHRPGKSGSAMKELREELGRVERVLTDITHDLDHSSGRLDSVSDELRGAVMRLRMVPVGGVLRKHHRTVRDLANGLGKRARVELTGEDTELDKLLVEALDEPLLHLVRNSVDHGLEAPEVREKAGKSPEGVVSIRAMQRGNQVIIEVGDDGKGIDPEVIRKKARERKLIDETELASLDDREVLDLIFRAGFSTAKEVSDVSGRGVGMDVVKQTIVNQLKGTIEIRSEVGQGSTMVLSLPLTLAITQVLLARAGGEVFAVPLDSVLRTLNCSADEVQLVQEREVLTVRGRQVPLVRLVEVLELSQDPGDDNLCIILTEHGGNTYGLVCEGLLEKKEIVIKSLGNLLTGVPCTAGATLLGNTCAVILDVGGIIERALTLRRSGHIPRRRKTSTAPRAGRVLLVEDSDMVRESLRRLLVDAGYEVTVARDGVEGLDLARTHTYDLVSTDVMMPRMDGYELTRALRALPEYREIPIVMVTSRGERIDRVRGFDAGVDEYITKPHDRTLLLKAVTRLLSERQGE